MFVFDDLPATYIGTIRTLSERLHKHNLKTTPKATIGATEVKLLDHLAHGVRPNGDKVVALTQMPIHEDVKQLRSLLGGLSYYREVLPLMAKRIRRITSLVKKGVVLNFTKMETIARQFLAELATPLV